MSLLDEVRWIDLPSVADDRGVLTSVEAGRDVPFPIRRVFYMHGVRADRGGHAHRDTEQLVTAVAGGFRVTLSDASRSRDFVLDDPCRGIYMPAMLFVRLHAFSPGAVCLVFASTPYDMNRSIRSWEDYTAAVAGR